MVMQLRQVGKSLVNQVILGSMYLSRMILMFLDLKEEHKHCLASDVSFDQSESQMNTDKRISGVSSPIA